VALLLLKTVSDLPVVREYTSLTKNLAGNNGDIIRYLKEDGWSEGGKKIRDYPVDAEELGDIRQ
jgi:hypothetical protein